MRSIRKHLLNFDSSLYKVILAIWAAMMILYCLDIYTLLPLDQAAMAEFICGEALGIKEGFIFPILASVGLAVIFIFLFLMWGDYPSKIPRLSPKGISVAAAASLVAALCIFLALFFFPCSAAGTTGNGMGMSKYGEGLVALAQKNFPIYSFLHSILLGCFYRGCVISIKAGRI